jgi:23S rRNA (cytidine1920-2'-O)/16S rRNA (cytidine1409-2'-O)-methyltransferase
LSAGGKKTGLRLDALLVSRGLAADERRAQALVLAGQVLSGDTLLDKPGLRVAADLPLRLRGQKAFASRAGAKLEAGLEAAGFQVEGLRCLDLGASTGGFTHCLLKRGAAKVIAVEAGYNQLDWALRQDPRVDSREGCDALGLSPEALGGPVDFACADLSFAKSAPFFPLLAALLAKGAAWVFLVKPQFEVGVADLDHGIVRDLDARQRALAGAWAAAQAAGLGPLGHLESPLAGAKGNHEWLLWGRR